jgi:hypothetical protein
MMQRFRRASARALALGALPCSLAALAAIALAPGCGDAGETVGEATDAVTTTGLQGQYYDNADFTNLKPEFEDFLRLRAPGLSDFAGLAGSEARKA